MKLNVPLLRQRIGSVGCGHICIQMILKYHGIEKSYREMKSEIDTHDVGTYTPQLGSFMIANGFKTNIITLHPGMFSLDDINISQKEVSKIVHNLKAKEKKDSNKITLDYYSQYLKDGGTITPKIPDETDIRKEIDAGNPILALLTSNFLTGVKRKFNFHFNVITGIDKTHVYVNDPLKGKRGGSKKFKIRDYLYAIHASAYGDLDNATLMTFRLE